MHTYKATQICSSHSTKHGAENWYVTKSVCKYIRLTVDFWTFHVDLQFLAVIPLCSLTCESKSECASSSSLQKCSLGSWTSGTAREQMSYMTLQCEETAPWSRRRRLISATTSHPLREPKLVNKNLKTWRWWWWWFKSFTLITSSFVVFCS